MSRLDAIAVIPMHAQLERFGETVSEKNQSVIMGSMLLRQEMYQLFLFVLSL